MATAKETKLFFLSKTDISYNVERYSRELRLKTSIWNLRGRQYQLFADKIESASLNTTATSGRTDRSPAGNSSGGASVHLYTCIHNVDSEEYIESVGAPDVFTIQHSLRSVSSLL